MKSYSQGDLQTREQAMQYVAYSVLHEEMEDGHVWITDDNILEDRTPIKIVRRKEGRTYAVFCDGLLVDKNYERHRCRRAAVNAQACEENGQCPISIGMCDRTRKSFNPSFQNNVVLKKSLR